MDLATLLETYQDAIVREWAHRLNTEVSDRYRQRPLEELLGTTSEAAEADFAVLVKGDFSKIDRFIEKITRMRLQAGFPLSDVQKAFELYRTVLLPLLVREMEGEALLEALRKLNDCLSYTICKFSDYFQSLHEQQIREHAENLEREVEKRTQELAESEAKYRVLVEEINDGYFVVQRERIVFANRAFCEMHGYRPEEVLGRPYTDFVAPESLEEVRRLYEGRTGGRVDLFVYFRLHKDGRSLPTENKVKVIHYQGRKAAAGICRDITERVEMERRMRESERLAHIGQLTTSLDGDHGPRDNAPGAHLGGDARLRAAGALGAQAHLGELGRRGEPRGDGGQDPGEGLEGEEEALQEGAQDPDGPRQDGAGPHQRAAQLHRGTPQRGADRDSHKAGPTGREDGGAEGQRQRSRGSRGRPPLRLRPLLQQEEGYRPRPHQREEDRGGPWRRGEGLPVSSQGDGHNDEDTRSEMRWKVVSS